MNPAHIRALVLLEQVIREVEASNAQTRSEGLKATAEVGKRLLADVHRLALTSTEKAAEVAHADLAKDVSVLLRRKWLEGDRGTPLVCLAYRDIASGRFANTEEQPS